LASTIPSFLNKILLTLFLFLVVMLIRTRVFLKTNNASGDPVGAWGSETSTIQNYRANGRIHYQDYVS
jgi:hypothetical protein